MKKIGLLTLIILMLGTLVVNAEATVTEKMVDISNSRITIKGVSTEPNQTMTVQVFNSDKKLIEILTTDDAENYVAYVGQSVTDEDGNFTFSFKYEGSADKEVLNGYIIYDSTTMPEHFTVEYTKVSFYETLIGDLNTSANNENFTDFYKYCFENKEVLCPELSIAGDIDFEKAVKIFCGEVKKDNLDSNDSITNEKRFMNAIVTQMYNEGKGDSIKDFADMLYLEKSLIEDIKSAVEETKADKYFTELISNKGIDTDKEFTDKITEGMILTSVAYPKGFSELKDLCEEYGDFIGIGNKKYTSDVYKEIAGEKISSVEELKDRLAEEDDKKDDEKNSGKGSSGGGGGSSSGRGASVAVTGDVAMVDKAEEINMPFVDLSATAWAYEAVSVLADKGIVNGKTATEFYPNDYVTREEFAKMIAGALGLDTAEAGNKFTDVDNNSWYAKYVYAAYENGICKGISDSEFGVGNNIIRQDAAVMVYNGLADAIELGTTVDFSDYDEVSEYAKTAVDMLSSNGIINGKGNNTFEPQNLLTRAEAAQIIYKAFFGI